MANIITLQELQRSQFNISPITQKAIDRLGLGKINFRSAILKYPDSLLLRFTVASSEGRGSERHVTNNGDFLATLGGYRVAVQCINFGNIVPPNFLSLPLSQQIIYIKEIFDKSDLKFGCTCPAFYWQGNSELLDRNPPDANYDGFTGQFGQGIWDKRHNTKNRICKHIKNILENMDNFIPKILKDLNKNTSVSSSTAQNTTLVAPQKPAGTPEEKKDAELSTTIKSEKAEDTVEDDIREIKSHADSIDLPKVDSKVEAKSLKDKSDVLTGKRNSEPPIEDIILSKETEENEDIEKPLPTSVKEWRILTYKDILNGNFLRNS